MFNTDLVLQRDFQIKESKVLQFRLETFNVFNHTQFFGPAAVNGDVDNAALWPGGERGAAQVDAVGPQVHVLSAAARPRKISLLDEYRNLRTALGARGKKEKDKGTGSSRPFVFKCFSGTSSCGCDQ